jgi:hypothetical protein
MDLTLTPEVEFEQTAMGLPPIMSADIIIISLLMSPLLGHRPSLWITYKESGP